MTSKIDSRNKHEKKAVSDEKHKAYLEELGKTNNKQPSSKSMAGMNDVD